MTFPNQILVAATLVASFSAMAPEASAADRRVPQDFETIQAAVDAAVEGVDRVVVSRRKEGPYAENVVVSTPNITLLGKRAELDGQTDGIALTINADGVTVTGFIVRNASGDGIQVNGDDVVVERCDVQGCLGNGIAVNGSNAIIERNTVRFVGGNGVDFDQTSDAGTTVIERNTVTSCGGSGIVANGGDIVIERNTIEGNAGDGVQMNNGGYTDSAAVASNRVRDNVNNGVCVFEVSAGGILIERNTIETNGGNGTVLESGVSGTIDRNKYRNNRGNGICLTASSIFVTNNRIDGSSLNGIKTQNLGAGNHEIIKNTVRTSGRDGIWISGGKNNVLNNTCDRNLGDGIDIVAQVQGDSASNTIGANRANRNGHEGIDNSGFNTSIIGNKLSRNGPGGLGPDIAGSGNKADPLDAVGIGTVSNFEDNKTSDDTEDDATVAQTRDF